MIPIKVKWGAYENDEEGSYEAEDIDDLLSAIEVLMEYESIVDNECVWIEIGRDEEW